MVEYINLSNETDLIRTTPLIISLTLEEALDSGTMLSLYQNILLLRLGSQISGSGEYVLVSDYLLYKWCFLCRHIAPMD